MALAARCPHCHALFRVVADQLKLRGGLVRCGQCRKVFDAISGLSYVDDVALAKERAQATVAGAAHAGPSVALASSSAPARAAAPSKQPPQGAAPRERSRHEATPVPSARTSARAVHPSPAEVKAAAVRDLPDALAVPTLFGPADPAHELVYPPFEGPFSDQRARAAASREDEASQAPEGDDQEPQAPSFLPADETRDERRLRWALTAACVPLAVLGLLQFVLTLRGPLLELSPSLRPALVHGCSLLGCTAGWPAHSELLTIVASELEVIPGTDVIELDAAIRSRADFVMALPAIEVTLTDTQNRAIARKVFLPADYLASSGEPSSRIDEGLAPGSDLSVRLVFEARGLSAAGFVLYPFYA